MDTQNDGLKMYLVLDMWPFFGMYILNIPQKAHNLTTIKQASLCDALELHPQWKQQKQWCYMHPAVSSKHQLQNSIPLKMESSLLNQTILVRASGISSTKNTHLTTLKHLFKQILINMSCFCWLSSKNQRPFHPPQVGTPSTCFFFLRFHLGPLRAPAPWNRSGCP